MTSNVLIISTKIDPATDDVVQRLAQKHIPHYRLNTEDYPFTNTITYQPHGNDQWLWCNDQPLPHPTSIWYRRVRTPPTPTDMDEGVSTFCRQETRAAIIGSIIGTTTRWMSHPTNIWQAEYKPYQLTIAAQLGIPIPRTIITNNPTRIREAFNEFNGMIVKPTRTGHLTQNGVDHAIYTSRVLKEHLDDLETAHWSTAIYQEHIKKQYDIRVTIVGQKIFTAAIDSQTDPAAITDWRQTNNPNLPHHQHQLPSAIESQLLNLTRTLGLSFGAIDLIQTPDDEYVFLEINPSGQWLWLDDQLHLGISDAITDWLSCND